jgi:predicted translin family RNA/ssDNA-binding protein
LEKREEVTRISREITLESKKFIFTLQRYAKVRPGDEKQRYSLDSASQQHVQTLQGKLSDFQRALNLSPLAPERTDDQEGMEHLFGKQISMGLQEYVEAVCFQRYIQTQTLLPYVELRSSLHPIQLTVGDYIDGVLDFTGELMRFAITANDPQTSQQIHSLMLDIFHESRRNNWSQPAGSNINGGGKSASCSNNNNESNKIQTFESSLQKVEQMLLDHHLKLNEVY